jgi:hypothetical protein
VTTPEWDRAYEAGIAGWDIGRPQPAFVRLADEGLLRGRVFDPARPLRRPGSLPFVGCDAPQSGRATTWMGHRCT